MPKEKVNILLKDKDAPVLDYDQRLHQYFVYVLTRVNHFHDHVIRYIMIAIHMDATRNIMH